MDPKSWFGAFLGLAGGFLLGATTMLTHGILLVLGLTCVVLAFAGQFVLRWKRVGVLSLPKGPMLKPVSPDLYKMELLYAPDDVQGGLRLAVRHPRSVRVVAVTRSCREEPADFGEMKIYGALDKPLPNRLWWTIARLEDWRLFKGEEIVFTLRSRKEFSPNQVKLYRRF